MMTRTGKLVAPSMRDHEQRKRKGRKKLTTSCDLILLNLTRCRDKIAAAKGVASTAAAVDHDDSDEENSIPVSKSKSALKFSALPPLDDEPAYSDEDDDDSLMATLKKNSASNNKKKAKGKKNKPTPVSDEDAEPTEQKDSEFAATETRGIVEVNADDWMEAEFGETKAKKSKKGGKKGGKAQQQRDEEEEEMDPVEVISKAVEKVVIAAVVDDKEEKEEEDKEEGETGTKVLSKSEKEKIKKEKEKVRSCRTRFLQPLLTGR